MGGRRCLQVALVTGGTRGIGLSTHAAARSLRLAFSHSVPPQNGPLA